MERKPSYELSAEELAYISQYLNGELDATEQAAFEQRLQTERVLQQKINEVKALLIGIREANMADRLSAWHEAAYSAGMGGRGAQVKPLYRRWWVAAAVAAMVLFGIWWGLSKPSDERLYRAYFVPDAGLPVAMGGRDTAHYAFYDGMISYKEGKYTDALAKWTPMAQATDMTDTLRYFSGMAYMGLDQPAQAVEQLLSVASDRRSTFYKEATWYLALCYLRQGERKAAASLLRRIADDGQAQELLKKLE